MPKNVIVVDEQGNQYEATYPKRAKGLVKNGRARFIDETTICLACPPNIKLEDNDMSEHTTVNAPVQPETGSEKLTVNYILEQIEQIASQTDYLHQAIAELGKMGDAKGDGDIAGQTKAMSLGNIVEARENTNRRLIAFYEKIYGDLKSRHSIRERALRMIERMDETAQLAPEDLNMMLNNLKDLSE